VWIKKKVPSRNSSSSVIFVDTPQHTTGRQGIMLPRLLVKRALPRSAKARMSRRGRLVKKEEEDPATTTTTTTSREDTTKQYRSQTDDNETTTTASYSAFTDNTDIFSHPSSSSASSSNEEEEENSSSSGSTDSVTDSSPTDITSSNNGDKKNVKELNAADQIHNTEEIKYRITVGKKKSETKGANGSASSSAKENTSSTKDDSDVTTTFIIVDGTEQFSYYSFRHATLRQNQAAKEQDTKTAATRKTEQDNVSSSSSLVQELMKMDDDDDDDDKNEKSGAVSNQEAAAITKPRQGGEEVFPKDTEHPSKRTKSSPSTTLQQELKQQESNDADDSVFLGLENDDDDTPAKESKLQRTSNTVDCSSCIEDDAEETIFDELALLLLGEEEEGGSDDGPSVAGTAPTQLQSLSSSSRKKVSFQLPKRSRSEDEAWNLEKAQRRNEKKLRKERRRAKREKKKQRSLSEEDEEREKNQAAPSKKESDEEASTVSNMSNTSNVSNISRFYAERNRALLDDGGPRNKKANHAKEDEIESVVLREYVGNPYKQYDRGSPQSSRIPNKAYNRPVDGLSAMGVQESPSDETATTSNSNRSNPSNRIYHQNLRQHHVIDAALPFLELAGEPAYDPTAEDGKFLLEQQYMKPSVVEFSPDEQRQQQQHPGKNATPMSSLTTRSRQAWASRQRQHVERHNKKRPEERQSDTSYHIQHVDVTKMNQESQEEKEVVELRPITNPNDNDKKVLKTIESATARYQKPKRTNKTTKKSCQATTVRTKNKTNDDLTKQDDTILNDMTQMYNDVMGAINDIGSDMFWTYTDDLPKEEPPLDYLPAPPPTDKPPEQQSSSTTKKAQKKKKKKTATSPKANASQKKTTTMGRREGVSDYPKDEELRHQHLSIEKSARARLDELDNSSIQSRNLERMLV